MNDRFYIFMRSVDDELLEEAQKPMPRRHFSSFAACLALCLCLAAYSYIFFIPAAQKSEDAESAFSENSVSDLPLDAAQNSDNTHMEDSKALLPLPKDAALISLAEADGEITAVFTAYECDFSLSVFFDNQTAGDVSPALRLGDDGVLWHISQNGLIVWHMEDGARFAFSFSEDEGDAAYNVLSEIAQNLHIDLPKEVADVFCVK